ncbi:MAG: orotidine-5'-phosphate decarboxylase [Acidobacteriota bacterium]
MSTAVERVIVALDHPTAAEALSLARRLRPRLVRAKIGAALFTTAGSDVVRSLQDLGLRVFLDLKLHDIPSVVEAAARAVARLGVEFLSVHLAGGTAMVRAALEGAGSTKILGVTLLSSLDAAACASVGFSGTPEQSVLRLARLGRDAGVDGIVASAREAAALRSLLPPPTRIVTPGIRPAGTPAGDQARTATPAEAIRAGADLLVVGRPVSAAADPVAAFDAVAREACA